FGSSLIVVVVTVIVDGMTPARAGRAAGMSSANANAESAKIAPMLRMLLDTNGIRLSLSSVEHSMSGLDSHVTQCALLPHNVTCGAPSEPPPAFTYGRSSPRSWGRPGMP